MMRITAQQQALLREIVKLARDRRLNEEFCVSDAALGGKVVSNPAQNPLEVSVIAHFPKARTETFQALANAGFLIVTVVEPSFGVMDCSLTGEAYFAVDSNFAAPDNSFVMHLTPLADLTNFDDQLKRRCL